MYAVKAIYDGASIKPVQPITINGQYEVVVTFLQSIVGATPNPRILREADPKKSSSLGLWEGELIIPDDFNESVAIITPRPF